MISGGYGVGKTHLLDYMAVLARRKRFAVVRMEFDTRDATPSHPQRVYRELLRNFEFVSGEGVGSFRDFVGVVNATRPDVWQNHPYFRALLARYKGSDTDEQVWNWITAVEPSSFQPVLHAYATASNVFCSLLTAISYAAGEVLGTGLVVILDEAERLCALSNSYQESRGHEFLTALVKIALGADTRLLPRTPYAQNLAHEYRKPSRLLLALGVTEPALLGQIGNGITHLPLESLSEPALRRALEGIFALHDAAYPGLIYAEQHRAGFFRMLLDRLPEAGRTRYFIRGTVEALDILREHPNLGFDGLECRI